MEKAKVSFIVPVYNAEKYIEKCVLSLINQSYKNIQIILVNDGSKDNSKNIIEELAKKYKNITVVNQTNGGPSKARNTGIKLAEGEYIAFVDADDYLDYRFSTIMLEKSLNCESDLVVCNYIEINPMGIAEVRLFNGVKNELENTNQEYLREILKGPGGLVWGKLFKNKIIKEKSITFNESYKMCEDLLFCMEYAIKAKTCSKCNDNLYIHNKCNEQSITAGYNLQMFQKQLEIQEILNEILEKNNIYTIENRKALNDRFKCILEYSLEKEFSKNIKNNLNIKMRYIREIITSENIKEYIKELKGNGPIDKLIVKSIQNKNMITLYIAFKLRAIIVYLYSKIDKLRRGEVKQCSPKLV